MKLSAVTPEEADRQTMLGSNLLEKGQISHLRFLEHYAMISDASGEMKRILVEKLLAQPELMAILARTAMEDWGMKELLEKLAPVANMGQLPPVEGAIPGQAPTPPATPGSAEEMALIEKQRLGGLGQGGELGSAPEVKPFGG